MVEHTEAWQVFHANGESRAGESILPSEARLSNKAIVGAVHIWIWRRGSSGIEVLLQRRAKNKPTWPDYLDISVAGHIDSGESQLQAAVREAEEEVGLRLNPSLLNFIFSYRNFENGIKWVYILEETEPVQYQFNDGEVQSLDWVTIESFENMTLDPEHHGLVSHPKEYFSLLTKALVVVHENNRS